MGDTDQALALARADLRAEQQRWVPSGAPPEPDPLGATLSYLALERAQQRHVNGELSDGWFRYDPASEAARWERTETIVRRVDPGPYEDPRFLFMLAHQAASIELGIPDSDGPVDPRRVLLGTTGEARNEAFSALRHGHVLVLLSAGMIDCMYQMAKCVTLSYVRRDTSDRPGVSFSVDPDVIAEHLRTDTSAVDLMADNLAAWLYQGRPRSPTSRMPAPELHGPLKLLINGAERFVIAHEYAHAFFDLLDTSDPLSPQERELRADAVAMRFTADSSRVLDRLPANMALQGAVLAMKANELTDLALSIARTGKPVPAESLTHPPFQTRLALLERFYLDQHDDQERAREELRGMQVPALLGDMVFATVQPRLQALYRSGQQLNWIWG